MKAVKKPGKRPASRTTEAGRKSDRRHLVSQIELLRMRVAAAQTTWKQAKEQASHAKRRRKLAKLIAKRAKKDAKTAKVHLGEARQALALAQAQMARPRRPATVRADRISNPPPGPQKTRARKKSMRKTPGVARIPKATIPLPMPDPSVVSEGEAVLPTSTIGSIENPGHE
jgi:hypothetical protein